MGYKKKYDTHTHKMPNWKRMNKTSTSIKTYSNTVKTVSDIPFKNSKHWIHKSRAENKCNIWWNPLHNLSCAHLYFVLQVPQQDPVSSIFFWEGSFCFLLSIIWVELLSSQLVIWRTAALPLNSSAEAIDGVK